MKNPMSQFPAWANIAFGIVLGIISTAVTIYVAREGTKKNDFDQDAQAIQLSVELEKAWETNLSVENRLKFVRYVSALNSSDPKTKKQLEYAVVNEYYLYNPDEIRKNSVVMNLLNLKLDSSNAEIEEELNFYRTSVFQTLNAMESVSLISCFYSRSDITRRIIDLQYRGIIEKRREELRDFIDLYNVEMHQKRKSDYKAWKSLYMAFSNECE